MRWVTIYLTARRAQFERMVFEHTAPNYIIRARPQGLIDLDHKQSERSISYFPVTGKGRKKHSEQNRMMQKSDTRITLWLTEVSDTRLKIYAFCKSEDDLGNFERLLAEIKRCYPDATTRIGKNKQPEFEETNDEDEIHLKRAPRVPSVPKGTLRCNAWKSIWRKVQGQWRSGKTLTDICEWINQGKDTDKIVVSAVTLRKIIGAGEAGRLD